MSPSVHFNRIMGLKGALASVALSHDENCSCDTCKAAAGDRDAFARVADAVFSEETRRSVPVVKATGEER